MNNLADLCRECELPHGYACSDCELPQKVQQLEQAGDRMAKRLCLIINSERTPDNASIDAVKNWWQVKGKKQ